MPKKFSEIQKKELIESFINGNTIDELSKKFNCTKVTITKHLKKNIAPDEFKKLLKNIQKKGAGLNSSKEKEYSQFPKKCIEKNKNEEEKFFSDFSFVEIPPLSSEKINLSQKDLASVSISDVNLPNIVYMVVDKKIELETKLLRDYPDWQFLSEKDLNRKTIEIHSDLKNAKRLCNKEQKVIKVPNTDVFRIAATLLKSKGITRIISEDQLIAL